jgi:hypothetical protein
MKSYLRLYAMLPLMATLSAQASADLELDDLNQVETGRQQREQFQVVINAGLIGAAAIVSGLVAVDNSALVRQANELVAAKGQLNKLEDEYNRLVAANDPRASALRSEIAAKRHEFGEAESRFLRVSQEQAQVHRFYVGEQNRRLAQGSVADWDRSALSVPAQDAHKQATFLRRLGLAGFSAAAALHLWNITYAARVLSPEETGLEEALDELSADD